MQTLRVAVSARALFDLEESNEIFLRQGAEAFVEHTREMQDAPLAPGAAFPLVKSLLALNKLAPDGRRLVEVMVITSFTPAAGLRVLKSIEHHGLPIRRASFTGNVPITEYLEAFGTDLFLSRSSDDAQQAATKGIAAAIMYDRPRDEGGLDDLPIRIAFDGDGVLFSDESERIYKLHKLPAFLENEKRNAQVPMNDGPFANVLRAIHRFQSYEFNGESVVRTILVTARGGEASERVLRTFDAWGIHLDEVHYLDGSPKAGLLKAFDPHIFFDDQEAHVGPASEIVPSGRVLWPEPLQADAMSRPLPETV